MAAEHRTLGVGFLLLGVGIFGLIVAHARRGSAAEPPPGPTPPSPGPVPGEGIEAPVIQQYNVQGRTYRVVRFSGDSAGKYVVQLMDGKTPRATYYFGPEGLEDIEGEPDDIALMSKDMGQIPGLITSSEEDENGEPIVPPPEGSFYETV